MIKVNFCDMQKGFDINNDILVKILKRNFGEIEISDNPDFLFFAPFGTEHHKFSNCVKIFICGEPLSPNFNECDYAVCYDPIQYGSRYMVRPVYFRDSMPEKINMTDEQALNRKFCNFVYSNDKYGLGSKLRVEFAKRLMKYKHVDCPGKVLNNMKDGIGARNSSDWVGDKLKFIKQYKFTIAFENCSCNGYTTEKLIHPLIAHSLPIYWGNPDVDKNFNMNAFVYANGYENRLDELVEMIIDLDKNDDKYLKMLHAKPMSDTFNYNELEDFEQFIVDIIKRGNVPFEKDPFEFTKRMSIDNLSRKDKIKYFLLK